MATLGKDLSAYDKSALPDATSFRFGIVVSQWNKAITEALASGAYQTLLENAIPAEQIIQWEVSGSFELIYGCRRMQQTQKVDAVIAIGSVIRGETKHFDFVCEAVSQGIKDLNVLSDIPAIFCVLTDDTLQQAQDRSGGRHGNKGTEAAVAAIQMAALRRRTM